MSLQVASPPLPSLETALRHLETIVLQVQGNRVSGSEGGETDVGIVHGTLYALAEVVRAQGEELRRLQRVVASKADVQYVTKIEEAVEELRETKVDAEDVVEELCHKVDVRDVQDALALKANASDLIEETTATLNHALGPVYTQLAQKVDRTEMVEELKHKVSKKTVASALEGKADRSDLVLIQERLLTSAPIEAKRSDVVNEEQERMRAQIHTHIRDTLQSLERLVRGKADQEDVDSIRQSVQRLEAPPHTAQLATDLEALRKEVASKMSELEVQSLLQHMQGVVKTRTEDPEGTMRKEPNGTNGSMSRGGSIRLRRHTRSPKKPLPHIPLPSSSRASREGNRSQGDTTQELRKELQQSMIEVTAQVDAKIEALRASSVHTANATGSTGSTGSIEAHWLWQSKGQNPTAGHPVPWTHEFRNTRPELLVWGRDDPIIAVRESGIYRVEVGVFGPRRPTLQLRVNGDMAISAIHVPASTTHHPLRSKKGKQRVLTGLSFIDFLLLPARAQLSLCAVSEEGTEGFLSITRIA